MILGGVCYHCFWGWPIQVAKIYQEARAKLGGNELPLEYGPAHIVWCDENFETCHVQWCLDNYSSDTFKKTYERYSNEELEIVRQSLIELLEIPEEVRCYEPDDYDGINPENYPPQTKFHPQPI